ncbi:FAD binding domain-containing protein [Limibacillus halophilus]|uniref:CO/xanthine dehydrogenase FAD-binding subunit n=1 Tax=Limibacillus halophilus TaxID=1579333 RepID=A0A839SU99_9PROT|nr:xanthine dehydrogenase family protein subunit M [Limibacillus halophilus]MBB3064503.1 CO/xanthine dehydrogenase FAD-binding subunit [Limibacillus halophilus]
MKAADFIYHRPDSIDETVGLLDDYAGNARILAGGQSIIPMMNLRLWRPSALIDIERLAELDGIEPRGDDTILGAMVRYRTIETHSLVAERLPLLVRMIHFVGDRQVRNRGTLGGSLMQADPTGEMPLAALTLGAEVTLYSVTGTRTMALEDFFVGSYATAAEPDEVLLKVRYPRHPEHFAFYEVNRRHNDFAIVSVAVVADRGSNGAWQGVRIGLGGVDETPVLAREAMSTAEGSDLSDTVIAEAARVASEFINPATDIRASEAYRRHLTEIYVARAMRDLRDETAVK